MPHSRLISGSNLPRKVMHGVTPAQLAKNGKSFNVAISFQGATWLLDSMKGTSESNAWAVMSLEGGKLHSLPLSLNGKQVGSLQLSIALPSQKSPLIIQHRSRSMKRKLKNSKKLSAKKRKR